ncbi:hypothetical protein EIP86_007038 [Pleurotus ostreatoroseus]|nr:hypothetical protein EIP86_007038 [Pleurotus ostreatoroseus]
MPIINPTHLVDEFKKTGEFDRLRRELLAQFRNSDNYASFVSRVEEVARQKLASDSKVKTLPETSMVKELMQDLNRYPIIERAVSEVQETTLSDPDFTGRVRTHVTKILQQDREGKPGTDGNATASPHIDTAIQDHTTLPVITQASEHHNGDVAKPDLKIQVPGAADGNESEDSAMLESPVSEAA